MNRKKAAVVGFFDGLHRGHRSLLDFARAGAKMRGLQPVAVTFRECPIEYLRPGSSPKLLASPSERLRALGEYLGSNSVIALDFNRELATMTAREFMLMLHDAYGVELLVVGFNNRFGSDRDKTFTDYQAIGREIGMEVERAPELGEMKGVSSSAIRKAISEGRMDDAAEMLGRRYAITGEVQHGRKVGRTIGFPTANLRPTDPRLLVPAPGVYSGTAYDAAGTRYPAMVNIGVCPTVSSAGTQTIEAHLIGFEGDLYGKTVTLEFTGRMRGERRFGSLDELKTQLEADRAESLQAFNAASRP